MKLLHKNGTIGIIAPGFYPDRQKLENGIRYLQKRGFTVRRGKSLTAQAGQLAGNDALRVDDLHAMFSDASVEAVICARGGWGSLRLLDKLDYNLLNKNRKILIGYSDITSLQLAFWKEIALPSLSGPMAAVEMAEKIHPFTEDHFWGQILNLKKSFNMSISDNGIDILYSGKGKGTLIGGCLSMITAQLATPFSPDYRGSVLFIEDINESLYKIDRHLAQLRYADVLRNLAALIIGDFINCEADQKELRALFREYVSDYKYPVLFNFPYGHSAKKTSLPIGAVCAIDTTNNIIETASCYQQL